MTPEYIADANVDSQMDQALRELLSACFTKPHDIVFRDRRYFKEPPRHRWIIRGVGGALIAHVAVHEKEIEFDERVHPIGGIAEVCVHPGQRGEGLVRKMLADVHAWLADHETPFAVLFGETAVYQSSGYRPAKNLYVQSAETGKWELSTHSMFRQLSSIPWPRDNVRLCGLRF